MEIHELNTFSGTPGAGDYLATDNGTDTAKIAIKTITDPLNARIDNIIAGGDAPSEAEIIDARLGADGVTYPSLGDAIRGQVGDLKSDLNQIDTRLVDVDGQEIIDEDDFDIGNITMSTSGWTYQTDSCRVRTKEGTTISLKVGDVVGLSNYSVGRFYLGWRRPNNTYDVKGWNTSDVTISEAGEYAILLAKLTDSDLGGNKSLLLDLLKIKRGDNALETSRNTAYRLECDIEPRLEVGNIDISTSGWVYGYNVNRARTRLGDVVKLYVGDVISLSDYSNYRFFIGWRLSDGTYKSGSGWKTSDYLVAEEGEYVILLSTISNSAPSSMAEMMGALSITHNCGSVDIERTNETKSFVKGVNHRGYSFVAPENTLPAYELSHKMGFEYVETDVCFTSDSVPVLLHDTTINRTARNSDGTAIASTINISDITYEQALSYDFGIFKGEEYAGTKIPTLEQFSVLCKKLGLHAYIEIKTDADYTNQQILEAINAVKKCGMIQHVSWLSFSSDYLQYVKSVLPNARLGFLCDYITEENVQRATALITNSNDVFLDVANAYVTQEAMQLAIDANIPVETWTVNDYSAMTSLNRYVTGVTSDIFNASWLIPVI